MKIITFLLVIVTLVLSVLVWNFTSDNRLLSGEIKKAKDEINAVKQEKDTLLKYKSQAPNSLDEFYLKVFSGIKEICSYYHAGCEFNIVDSKDFVNTREFFRESQYKGIRYVDVLCRIDLKSRFSAYLFDMLFRLLKSEPVEIMEVKIEKNILNLTIRLYGSEEGRKSE